jgi:L-2-hydroxyglutarate oxidase
MAGTTVKPDADFLVVGGGIVGLATAYTLVERQPAARVLVLEKETEVACHQSGRNSGVIHAGVYYEPGSLKARLCRAGLAATVAFCREQELSYAQCGKLIVATDARERERLADLEQRARSNSVACERLDRAELRAREPHIEGLAALYVHESGMVDYRAVARRLHALLVARGAEVATGAEVEGLREGLAVVEAVTPERTFTARHAVVCAGVQGDRLARGAGLALDFTLVPFRGDYYRLPPHRDGIIRHHIYPVPDPQLPFLGIHLTRLIDGGVSLGPSAMLALAREGYARSSVHWTDLRELVTDAGLWRLPARHHRAGLTELACAVSRRFYLRQARRFCPALTLDDLQPHPSGIRAQAVSRDGRLLHDFLLRRTARTLFVCNAPSPAATAALPIAAEIVQQLLAVD